jgi:hypothetical protein
MEYELQNESSVPEVDDEKHLEFIVNFPCTRFFCNGELQRGTHRGKPAVECSICDHVYYVLGDE